MASTAVPAVLRDELAVLAIDLVEVGSGSTKVSAVDVVVTASEATRIREKLLNSFAAIYVQELAETPDMPATRLGSSGDRLD